MEQTTKSNDITVRLVSDPKSRDAVANVVEKHAELMIRLPLEQVIADPEQPRKYFDPVGLEELVASVVELDIIEPVIVRPDQHGLSLNYKLVSGERRWRAAKAVCELFPERNTIPAIIMELSDEQAREYQIVENLQRQDVHPMEEAIAFLSLMTSRQMTVEEAAKRVGKSVPFIRQRLKLNDLIPGWQRLFLKNAFSVSIALQLCVLPPRLQKEIYSSEVSKDMEKAEHPRIHIDQYRFNRLKGSLLHACFDLNDATLDKKMGACSACPFNSAVSLLFPDQEQKPMCANVNCLQKKSEVHLKRELSKAKEDPAVLLTYTGNQKPDLVEELQKEGHEVLPVGYDQECRAVDEPELPEWESFRKQQDDENMSERQLKKLFDNEVAEYKTMKDTFDQHVQTAKYKKAFVIHGSSNQGKYIYVELVKKAVPHNSRQAVAEGKASIEDIQNEIKRLKDRETRNKELDIEKIHRRIAEAVEADNSIQSLPAAGHPNDTVLIHFLVEQNIDYFSRDIVKKSIGLDLNKDGNDHEKKYKQLQGLTKGQLSFLVRYIFKKKFPNVPPGSFGGFLFRKMAESLGTIPIKQYQKEQDEIAAKRQEKVTSRIAQLEAQKKKLTASAKVTPSASKAAKTALPVKAIKKTPSTKKTPAKKSRKAARKQVKKAVA